MSAFHQHLSNLNGVMIYDWPAYNIALIATFIFSCGSLWNFAVAERIEYLIHTDVGKLARYFDTTEDDKSLFHLAKTKSLKLKGSARGYAALVITLGAFAQFLKPNEIEVTPSEKLFVTCIMSKNDFSDYETCRLNSGQVRKPRGRALK
ncbi:hypothetical protein [Sphingomonas sp.]|uniref:hypothetical protein n=1 Tax=Sphingomonas sp. TaxID=28214 RepID=UPI0028AE4B6E|nr:hypothetical protein [Sphingomonas sp.]